MLSPSQFRFLNETHDLADCGWDTPAIEKLWRYNLHYFDDLNATDAVKREKWHRALLEQWISENPAGTGTGWEPYPTSLRIVNWVKWDFGGGKLSPACVHSLAVQTRWLARRMEFHLLGNHLIANAKALIFAGFFFEGPEASSWLEKGFRVLAREMKEQILTDGGHFELSTMYHALALEDFLDLYNLSAAFEDAVPPLRRLTIQRLCDILGPMRTWLATMSHPDGDIAFFNDAAKHIACTPGQLEHYAERLCLPRPPACATPLALLSASGYLRVERDGAVTLLDVARVGPDYLPGHAHADSLSFEFSLFGQRVLVNSGTSLYGTGAERLRQRGTAAHNTVAVNGQNSSEVWGGFRVARRARPKELKIIEGADIFVSCAHDGYRRLTGAPEHLRRWTFTDNRLVVGDEISGTFAEAQARFHLHPSITLEPATDANNESTAVLCLPGGRQILFSIEGGSLRREPSTWHSSFGSSESNHCLVVSFRGPVVRTQLSWGTQE